MPDPSLFKGYNTYTFQARGHATQPQEILLDLKYNVEKLVKSSKKDLSQTPFLIVANDYKSRPLAIAIRELFEDSFPKLTSQKLTTLLPLDLFMKKSRKWCQESLKQMDNSKFSIFLRGDDYASNRLQDIISRGSIPITIIDNKERELEWLPFKKIIPWKKMIVLISRDKYMAKPWDSISEIINGLSDDDISHLLYNIKRHRASLDFDMNGGYTYTEMVLKQTQITYNQCTKTTKQQDFNQNNHR
eukprot:Awhi_evm1s2199